jgi:hypothetical protein
MGLIGTMQGWMYVKTMGMWQKRYFKLAGQLLSFYKAKVELAIAQSSTIDA